ncbi:MAG: histone deacetylase [Phycisphaerae bacterium]
MHYSAGYFVQLPPAHRFPMGKYPALHDILLREGVIRGADVIESQEAEWADLQLVHTPDYLSDLAHATLSHEAVRRLGLPWQDGMLRRSRLAVGGTIATARVALADGVAANLAGGTHHAFADRGEGFCVLNDVAVAIRVLRRDGEIERAAIIDLDVHQGNGTAAIFEDDPATFTFSMHGQKNYPFHKMRSRLDVGLPDGINDCDYLAQLDRHLDDVLPQSRPELAFYLAGVDVVAGDRFGRLGLTRDGLAQRDRLVLSRLKQRGIPVAIVLSGGYAASVELTADLHATVHREAVRVFA